MKQAEQSETCVQVLCEHIEMCYGVAYALTKNPQTARRLTRDIMTAAWLQRENAADSESIKTKLLSALRARYLQHYRPRAINLASEIALDVESTPDAVDKAAYGDRVAQPLFAVSYHRAKARPALVGASIVGYTQLG